MIPSVTLASNSLDVPLTIKESTGVPRRNQFISSGIPLPQSENIRNTKHLRVVNHNGKVIPAQFSVLARWDGKPSDRSKAIKWVLVEFPVKQLKANQKKVYRLQEGSSKGAFSHTKTIHVKHQADTLTVKTGKAKFVLNKNHFSLFDQVKVGHNLLQSPNEAGAIITANNQSYPSNKISKFKIERSGRLHTIVLIKGAQVNTAGEEILVYTARLHFYAGQSYVRVQYGVWNDNDIVNVNGQPNIKEFGSPNTEIINDLTLRTTLDLGDNPRYTIGGTKNQVWRDNLNSTAQIYQDSSGGEKWHSDPDNLLNTFRGFKVTANNATLTGPCDENAASKNCRADGWIDLSSDQGGMAVASRYFWQNYPKALTVQKNGTVDVGLLPDAHQQNYEFRVGEQKTSDVMYYFHGKSIKPKRLQKTMLALNEPLQAWAPSSWYLEKTKTFHKVVPYNKAAFSSFEGYNDAAILYPDANLLQLADGFVAHDWLYGNRPESLGWRNFGDRVAEDETSSGLYPVFTNQQYDHPWFFVLETIRTLNTNSSRPNKWWSLAEPSIYQQVDIDTIHSRCTGKALEKMKDCMDPSTPTVIGWAMGGRLTNQWHAWSVPHIHRNALIDTWSGGIHGTLYYYYLTGEPLAKDGWVEAAKNARWKIENTPCNTNPDDDCGPGYGTATPHRVEADWGRESAYLLEISTDAFNATGDTRYLKAAQNIVSAMNPKGMWFADPDFTLNKSAAQTGATYSPWNAALMMRSLGYYLDTYKDWYGKADPAAQDVLLQYAKLSTKFWQLGADKPTQYRIFETGGYIADTGSPLEVATADGLIWALDYDDGSLDREYIKTVADEVFDKASHPWGGYAQNTFMTTKTHVMMGMNGWRYMHYKLNQD